MLPLSGATLMQLLAAEWDLTLHCHLVELYGV
jgi:hypothetical protein